MTLREVGGERVFQGPGAVYGIVAPDGFLLAVFAFADAAHRWKQENYKDRTDVAIVTLLVTGGGT